MLKHLLGVGVFPLAVRVLSVKIIFLSWRHKGTSPLLLQELVPVKVLEPNVFLDLFGTVQAQARGRLPLDELVDKISGFPAPPVGNILLLDLHLLGQDVVTDLLPVLPLVGTLTEHALVSDDTHREVVNRDAVVLPAHDLRGHVAGRTAGVLSVLWVPNAGNTQISDA